MTLSAPLGCISMAEERLRNMLAACHAFQAWTGTADAGAAKDRIYLECQPDPFIDDDERDGNFSLAELQDRRPFAIVWTMSYEIAVVGSPATPTQRGVLRMRFEDNVPQQYARNFSEAYRQFCNTIGLILQSNEQGRPGLMELLSKCPPEHLDFQGINFLAHEHTPESVKPTQGDAQAMEFEIPWGARI